MPIAGKKKEAFMLQWLFGLAQRVTHTSFFFFKLPVYLCADKLCLKLFQDQKSECRNSHVRILIS